MSLATLKALLINNIVVREIWCQNPYAFWSRGFNFSLRPSHGSQLSREFRKLISENAITVTTVTPPHAKTLNAALLQAGAFDALICAGSSIIFPAAFLHTLKRPALNIHPALLPSYRGPLPMHAMILDGTGDKFGGLTLHELTVGIAEGPIVIQKKIPLKDFRESMKWKVEIMNQIGSLITEGLVPFLKGDRNSIEQPKTKASYFSDSQIPKAITSSMDYQTALNFAERGPFIFPNIKVSYYDKKNRQINIRIHGLPEKIGPKTGELARITLFGVEMDLVDCRVSFNKDNRARRTVRKVRHVFRNGVVRP